MILGQPLVVMYFCKERTHFSCMVLDQFSTLAQDCGTLCLHQLETHSLFQYLDYKLKPYFFHTTWKTDASTHEFIMPHAWNSLLGLPYFLCCNGQAGLSAVDCVLCTCPLGMLGTRTAAVLWVMLIFQL